MKTYTIKMYDNKKISLPKKIDNPKKHPLERGGTGAEDKKAQRMVNEWFRLFAFDLEGKSGWDGPVIL